MIQRLLIALTVLMASTAMGQPSFWFSQFQKQGNAQYAQQYFATNGPGIAFSFDGVHWVISATGTNYVVATSTNATYAQYSTNWFGSNALYLMLSGQITNYTPGTNITFTMTSPHSYRIDSTATGGSWDQVWTNDVADGQIIVSGLNYSPYLEGFGSGWPIAFDTNSGSQLYLQSDDGTGTNTVSLVLRGQPYGGDFITARAPNGVAFDVDGEGNISFVRGVYYSWPTYSSTGSLTNDGVGNLGWSPSSGTTTGLTTNFPVVFGNGSTNTLNFTNGLLMAINGALGPSHGPSILLESGSYILLENGGTILKE